jgi:hypothetical protein
MALGVNVNITFHLSFFRFPTDFFPLDFPTRTLYASLSPSIRATCPVRIVLLDLIGIIIFNGATIG